MSKQLVGLCEQHYQQANRPGGTRFTFEFDNFDAFAAKEKQNG